MIYDLLLTQLQTRVPPVSKSSVYPFSIRTASTSSVVQSMLWVVQLYHIYMQRVEVYWSHYQGGPLNLSRNCFSVRRVPI